MAAKRKNRKVKKLIDFKGGFLVDAKKARKTKGAWTYNDTRDYRFAPDMFKL